MKQSSTKVAVIIICLIVALVGYYGYLSNKSKMRRQEASMTVVEEILSRDLDRDYPATPKEVIKYYNEITICLYNEECTEKEIEELGIQARLLYDKELLEANEQEEYVERLKSEVKEYKDNKRRITSASVAASTNVDYFEEDGFSFARIMCGYNIVQNGNNYPVKQVYLLRRNDDKKWKIYGWDIVENLQDDEE